MLQNSRGHFCSTLGISEACAVADTLRGRLCFLRQSTQRKYLKTVFPFLRHPATVPAATTTSAASSYHHNEVRF